MLQAHSFLWHYLWVAPNLLLLILVFLAWRRGFRRQFPIFLAFAAVDSLAQLSVYAADVISSVPAETFWRVFWGALLVDALLKFALMGEIYGQVFGQYPSLAKLGKLLIRSVGGFVVLSATLAAAFSAKDSPFGIVSGAHILEQTIYMIECGILLTIFGFAAYFRLSASRAVFGIALGLGLSACVHLATWAVVANGGLPDSKRIILDFANMATYHVCVLIWCFSLLVPQKIFTKSAVPLPEHDLEIWNRELERLLQQ